MTGVSDESLYIDAITNNSFSLESVEENLKKISNSSFNSLLKYQESSIDLIRYDFKLENIDTMDNDYLYLNIPRELIEQYTRKEYRDSKFFNEWVSLNDIAENRKIFSRIPLVFFDGLFFCDFNIKIPNGKTVIRIPKYRNLMDKKDIVVFFLLNDGMNIVNTNKYVISEYDGSVPTKLLNEKIENQNDAISLMVNENDDLGTPISTSEITDNSVNLKVTGYSNDYTHTDGKIYLYLISSKYLTISNSVLTTYNVGEDIQIEPFIALTEDSKMYDNPIPTSNIIVCKYSELYGEYIIASDITVTLKYPNIYIITDANMVAGNKYKIIYFYYPVITSKMVYETKDILQLAESTLGMTDTQSTIKEILTNNIERYRNLLLDYIPPDYNYSNDDFIESMEYPYYFDYKVNSTKRYISKDANNLRRYLNTQSLFIEKYYLNISRIDLSTRERFDTQEDIPDIKPITFDEMCYVFILANGTTSYLNLRFYIDGFAALPKCIVTWKGYEYIYIPAKLISETSFIVVEKFLPYSKSIECTFESTNVIKRFSFVPEKNSPFIISSDVRIINNSTDELVPIDNFDIYGFDEDGFRYPLNNVMYSPIKDIGVSLKTYELKGLNASVVVKKRSDLGVTNLLTDGITMINIDNQLQMGLEYFRVFINGRLVPDSLEVLYTTGAKDNKIIINAALKEGTQVIFDWTPYKWKKIYSLDEIPSSGRLNLAGIINKPFSMKSYDIYVNGKRVEINNISVVTPTKICLYGLSSLKNLWIFERERDADEYFGFDETNYKTLNDKILDGDIEGFTDDEREALYNQLVANNKFTEGEIPENTDDEPDWTTGWVSFNDSAMDLVALTEDMMYSISHINPDINQITTDALNKYAVARLLTTKDSTAIDDDNVLQINSDMFIDNALDALKLTSSHESTGMSTDDERSEW